MLQELRVCSSLCNDLRLSEISLHSEGDECGYLVRKSTIYFSSGTLWPPLSTQISNIGNFSAYVVDKPIFVGSLPRAFNHEWILVDTSNIPHPTPFLSPRNNANCSNTNGLVYDIDFSRLSPVGLRGYFLSHSSFQNYGHFIMQVIPWLHYLVSRCDLVIIPELTMPYQLELLNLFQIPLNILRQVRMPESTDNFYYSLEDGIFCESISHYTGFKYLRNTIEKCGGFPGANISLSSRDIAVGSGRVFLSRGSATRISNESEVIDIARRFGFTIVNALRSTTFEIYSILRNATIVIIDPGASITNLLFAPYGTDVVYFNPLPCRIDHGSWSNVSFTLSWLPLYFRLHNISASINSISNYHSFCEKRFYSSEQLMGILHSLV